MKQINLQENLRKKFIKKGVKMIAPNTVFFSIDTKIGKNVSIEPYVVIGKKVKINNNVTIHSFSHLENTKIENTARTGFTFCDRNKLVVNESLTSDGTTFSIGLRLKIKGQTCHIYPVYFGTKVLKSVESAVRV